MKIRFGPVRDSVLLVAGLLILANEVVLEGEPRVALLTLAAAMIGLPATFFADRRFTLSPPSETNGASTRPPTPPERAAGTSAGTSAVEPPR